MVSRRRTRVQRPSGGPGCGDGEDKEVDEKGEEQRAT